MGRVGRGRHALFAGLGGIAMSWHYQARKRFDGVSYWYDIVEMYEDPRGWTVNAIAPMSESVDELLIVLQQMMNDVREYPVLDESQEPTS